LHSENIALLNRIKMTANLPADSLTFLFTDIEGSTQLWEQHPEAMQVALARHDAILRQAIETHGGQVFKTVGDAFCAVFPNAPDAISSALDAQRALYTENWGETVIKVRMGLHSGAAEVRDNDYFGPTLNRVARLMSAGHGGQTLLSAITRELVQSSLPPDTELRDLGERGLKDLIRPEHIYQLTTTGLQSDFPPLKTLEAFHTNLPVQITNYIRREKEFSIVKSLMAEHRLITLTGSGGTGKTRLSLQIAADFLDAFPDGVWFIEFAPLADPALVPQTVLSTLGLREETGRPVLETLTHYLVSKEVLLILDNCEHLIEAAAQFAETVLHACPNLRLLASSREALGIAGEKIYYVRSLSIPNTRIRQSVETITQYEAVRLFVDRAQTALSSFTITPANVSAVAQICARLDGIPLAIELAAARVKLLKAEQIAERLDDRFRLLTGGSRTALPRQQTLRAMIDWSYDLLPESERVLLCRLSVFAGGWTLEAAETVCQGPGIDDYNVLDPLAQLVNKSLVVVDADDKAETRYRLLETVRQYAREKLSETGEGMVVRDLHLQYFLGLAERAEPELVGPQVLEWLNKLEIELDNIRTALEWSLKQNPEVGMRLVNALLWFWDEGGHFRDGYDWLTELLNHPGARSHTRDRARALGVMGYFLSRGDFGIDARLILEESLALYRELDDKSGIAHALLYEGIFIYREHDARQGAKLILESLVIYRELGHKLGIFDAITYLGNIIYEYDYPRARAYLVEALEICYEIDYRSGIARSLANLGHLALRHADYPAAHDWLEKALAAQRQLRKSRYAISTLRHLGELAGREGDYTKAQAYYKECLALIDQTGGLSIQAGWVLVTFGHASIWQGNLASARNFLEQSMQHFTKTNEKIGVVFTVEGLARLALMQERPAQAACLFAWADVTREMEVIDNPRPPAEQAEVDRDLAKICALLTPAAFDEAKARGHAMSMDDAIAFALQAVNG
jgi:predicted ATPase/class 3 adenylate cyclase